MWINWGKINDLFINLLYNIFMATDYFDGKEVKEIELLDLFPASEGMISQYYGRIGSGKTYSATADVLELLRRGKVVYTNWKINYEGFDERKSLPYIIRSIIFPWRKRFYFFPKDNLKFLDVDKEFHDKFQKLTDCHVFLDEGHVVFDSYEMARMNIERRKSILHTRHFNRSIHIISQRPTAIHVAMRANVNVFYKCEHIWSILGLVRFRRTEFQDMLNETVDENEEKICSVKFYWGKKKIFDAYNTKYLRGDMPASQRVEFKAFDFPFLRRFKLLWRCFLPKRQHVDNLSDNKKEEKAKKLSTEKKLKVNSEKTIIRAIKGLIQQHGDKKNKVCRLRFSVGESELDKESPVLPVQADKVEEVV